MTTVVSPDTRKASVFYPAAVRTNQEKVEKATDPKEKAEAKEEKRREHASSVA